MLDRAISRGRGRVEVFEPFLSDRLLSKMHLESDLYEAIANDELLLHYQPIVDTKAGCVKGFEALVRWQKPDGRMISPGEFIPVAEESGAIRDLDEWVLRQACRQVRAFLDVNPNVYVSVNVSADQFANPNLAPGVLLALSRNGIPGSALQLEITESALVQEPEAGVLVMRELREHGVRFALDDFGTGYSSLGYLKMFPFDTLKIDRSFVRQITAPKGRPALVKAIVDLALALDLDVVAEGVESRDELAFLQAERCERVQGFLFSASVPPERALEILSLGSLAR
jgi:EAL domain-containing protein (putative c-di-GMP-specific phosphodiesterase class I)